ncbi:unnamed protein product [Effrenium voratum]|uniref:DBP10 C-terminal domain-containing protein n=1 Tax=Effrenium voratum TaxID=2562239 RepID=A0AA36ID53_9DINO|nr:unnamed protein product [Effrenium voratum]
MSSAPPLKPRKESDCCAIRAFYSGSGAPATAGVTRVVFYLKRGTPRGEVDELEEKEWLHLAEDLISYGSPEKYLYKGSGPCGPSMETGARLTGFPWRGQGGGGNAAGMTAGGGDDEDPDDEYEPVDVELPAAGMGAGTVAPRPRSRPTTPTASESRKFFDYKMDPAPSWGGDQPEKNWKEYHRNLQLWLIEAESRLPPTLIGKRIIDGIPLGSKLLQAIVRIIEGPRVSQGQRLEQSFDEAIFRGKRDRGNFSTDQKQRLKVVTDGSIDYQEIEKAEYPDESYEGGYYPEGTYYSEEIEYEDYLFGSAGLWPFQMNPMDGHDEDEALEIVSNYLEKKLYEVRDRMKGKGHGKKGKGKASLELAITPLGGDGRTSEVQQDSAFSFKVLGELLEECGGPAQLQSMLHPAFRGKQTSQPGTLENSEYVRTLRGFRPKIEKLGNVLSVNAMRTMEQAKLDAAAVSEVRQSAGEACDAHSAEAEELELAAKPKGKRVPKAKPRDKPRLSKKARKMLKEGVEADDADFDIRISGGDAKPKRGEGEQFYLSTAVDLQAEAREKGFEMEQYQMDLLPDDSTDIKKAKSVMRWDAKRKKYLPTMVTADGKALKGQRRNESGKKVKGDGEKSKIYEKWSKATKRRIQKVGEVEDASADPLGKLQKSQARVVDFDAEGEVETARKPVVPFHGTVSEEFLTHKQKRALKKRAKLDTVAAGTEAKAELKTPQQIQQEKKLREKNKLKQKPWLRKAKARESKEARMKKLEERQMRYGARTKAKMLIFDGPRQWKKRAPAPQKGYGSRHSF